MELSLDNVVTDYLIFTGIIRFASVECVYLAYVWIELFKKSSRTRCSIHLN